MKKLNTRQGSVTEPFDYDEDPDRFRTNVSVVERYGLVGDVHEEVAARITAEDLWPALDLGCGEGRLQRAFGDRGLISTDLSRTVLKVAPHPKCCADMTHLPIRDRSVGSASALWCLYHVSEPLQAIREVYRVLRPGGLFVACAPSLYNDPEMAHLFPDPTPTPFDSEVAAELVGEVFGEVHADRWDVHAVRLPDEEAVSAYLRGRRKSREEAAELAKKAAPPLKLTKRGALVWAYRR